MNDSLKTWSSFMAVWISTRQKTTLFLTSAFGLAISWARASPSIDRFIIRVSWSISVPIKLFFCRCFSLFETIRKMAYRRGGCSVWSRGSIVSGRNSIELTIMSYSSRSSAT